MDQRVWLWRSPWEKRTYLFCSLFYLCLLLRQQVTAADTGYSQESKHDAPDSNKLDSLSRYIPYDSREDYKRGSAFFPLRGKKPSDDSLGGHQLYMPDVEDSEDKRSQFFPLRGKKVPDDLKRASYFMPMRGRKDDGWIDEDYDITDESPNKRASSFMPMRGKKKYAAISDFLRKAGTYPDDVSEVLNPSNSGSYQTPDKRMHSFVPVRGKRSYKESESPNFQVSPSNESQDDAASNHTASKRSVSFMPMRGRREFDLSDVEAPAGIVTSLLEKKMQSFMPMRGRKDDDEFENVDKKATFMPMRGRKDDDYQNMDSSEEKRAQSFMPMRGRRAHLRDVVFESSDTPEIESRLIEDKRASSFMPMRGRRSLSDDEFASESDLNKRASSFMPMRGRRSTDYSESEDFSDEALNLNAPKRVAFMPMRGRRFADEDTEAEPWPSDQFMSLSDKKSSAFMPMRGRRYDYRNITVDPWQADLLMSLFNKRSSAFMPMRGRRFGEYRNITVDPWQPDQLMSLFNKRSSAFMPMRGRRFGEYRNITVDPWQPDQLMSLFNKKSAFMPMRGRRTSWDNQDSSGTDFGESWDKRSSYFNPMRGRRYDVGGRSFYNPYPYLMAGMGSSLMSKPYSDQDVSFHTVGSADERRKKLRINWDAVKRAFHATRGKRQHEFVHSVLDGYSPEPTDDLLTDSAEDSNKPTRTKRSILRQRIAMQPNRQYIALKRPMSFFATRGKRLDDSALDKLSKLR